MTLCLAASTALITASERGGGTAASAGAVAALWSFTVCFSATWGPVVWVVQSEVLPLRNRAQGGAVGTFVNWVTNAIIAKAVPLLIDAAGAYTYLLFAGCCAAAFVYVALAVPETAGVSLEGMGALFRAHRRSKAAAAAEAEAAEAAAAECHFKQSA
jgi:SP family sugar:H+ symporter-like MFS transporter